MTAPDPAGTPGSGGSSVAAEDGGIFALGDAGLSGSTADAVLAALVVPAR